MFPEEFIRRIKTQQYIDDQLLLASLQEPSPASIRLNSHKWKRIPSGSVQVPWCGEGWYLMVRPSFTLDPLFHAGCYYPQEASGMFTGEVFSQVTPGMENLKVLDLCAAPGGKSTHLSGLIGNNGFLVANEVIKQRAKILADNITRWGLGNTLVTNNDPSEFSGLRGYFDVILVDAPCSGEGMFRDQVAINEWSVSNTLLCAERQKRILLDAWPSLKEGGVLIYSTCTFNPSENEEQVRWLIDTKRAESVTVCTDTFNGITEIEYERIRGYGFYPGKITGDGFFISVIKKLEKEEPADYIKNKTRINLDLKGDRVKVKEWLQTSPAAVLNEENKLFSVPVPAGDYSMLAAHLNIIKRGTEIFTQKNMDIIPSHDLVLSTSILPDVLPSYELTLAESLKFLRKDQFTSGTFANGWGIVKYMGVNLGLIKNIGSRINNYFPVEWRIRMSPDSEKIKNIIRWI